jgi:hypothetical protein
MKVRASCGRFAVMALTMAILTLPSLRTASATMIQLVASSPTLAPGASETISVLLTPSGTTASFQLTSADLDIQFDTSRFSISNVQLGSLDPSSATFTLGSSVNSNVLVSSIYANNGTGSPVTSAGTLETFTITALSNAPLGGGALQFLASSGNSHTDVYQDNSGNQIVLSPAPVNGVYDSNIDTTVTVTNTAVPEPSSLILMGLGGASIVVASRLRKKNKALSAA